MKKLIKTAVIIAACAGLCAGVWPRDGTGKEVPAEPVKSAASAELPTMSAPACALPIEDAALQATISTEEESRVTTATTVSNTANASPAAKEAFKSTAAAEPMPTAATFSDDPYHTDVYPKNVYSEEYLYDADGNLIGKTITYPTAFGPDTIWIGGHAYYDIPGFGLIEWSGPGSVTEDYTMYENGNKVGIMGGEAENTATATPKKQPDEQQDLTGTVIDQTINVVPEKNSTPPSCKSSTPPPVDPDARIAP
jgi:hypothetical protein